MTIIIIVRYFITVASLPWRLLSFDRQTIGHRDTISIVLEQSRTMSCSMSGFQDVIIFSSFCIHSILLLVCNNKNHFISPPRTFLELLSLELLFGPSCPPFLGGFKARSTNGGITRGTSRDRHERILQECRMGHPPCPRQVQRRILRMLSWRTVPGPDIQHHHEEEDTLLHRQPGQYIPVHCLPVTIDPTEHLILFPFGKQTVLLRTYSVHSSFPSSFT